MPEFMTVEIGKLVASRSNPRRHYDERGMAELVESIKQQGVLVPLLVRQVGKDGRYEVVAGSRRARAAKTAGLKRLPVRVMELTDDQVLEVQLIENLQREDVHPLDEAEGYRALMETGRYDVAGIAAKVDKSASYVYQRLKLTDLIPEGKKAFWEERITAGHAILIARLQAADQQAALQTCVRGGGYVTSVRDLGDWIHRTILLALSGAPFKPSDADLHPPAGACMTCTKRTGAAPELFPEVKKHDCCTDPACWRGKVAATIAARLAAIEARGQKPERIVKGWAYDRDMPKGALRSHEYALIEGKKSICDHARPAVIVAGNDIGREVQICTTSACKVHRRGGSGYRRSASEIAAEKKRNEAEAQKRETYRRARAAAVDQVIGLGPRELGVITDAVLKRMESDHVKDICCDLSLAVEKNQHGYRDYGEALAKHAEGLDKADRARLLVRMALRILYGYGWAEGLEQCDRALALFGQDPKKIAKQVAAEAAAAEKAKLAKAAKKVAKDKTAGRAAGKTKTRKAA